MKTGRPKQILTLTDEARRDLDVLAASRSMPHGLVQRARIILLAADGETNTAIAEKLSLSKPKEGTHWAVRPLAESARISKSTVHRIWTAFGLQPHRQKGFKLSTDPFFVEKVRDIVGLYLSPA